MSLEELVRGPNRSAGPDRSQPWTVIAAKTEGVTPGFTIRDGRGDLMVRLSDATGGIAGNVDVYLRNEATGPTIVGIERQFE